ncbi:MAG: carboxyvinyl-carboxyphosphonate phosphorylmutase [Acidimicrobiia bacterium]|nr:carboxyvinyl-carboxyphosphonate phosphorylmutase [Acidimicrobiia bacterium]
MPLTLSPRADFKARLAHGPAVLAPLCLDPLTARLCEQLGYGAGYLSGGALGYALAVSEALLTVSEFADATAAITRRSSLPLIVDGGVGFGDPVHTARAMWDLEAAGAVAIELEDQVAPKRVSHHRGVEHLVPVAEMVAKLEVAVAARRDPDFLVIARTGAVRHEGFEAAVARARAYAAAGADLVMLFPESAEQWRSAPERVGAPAVAMTAHGRQSAEDWAAQGWRLVIDPFTGQVVAVDAVRRAYAALAAGGPAGDMDQLMEVYRDLPVIAGLDELYDIERATTEPGT